MRVRPARSRIAALALAATLAGCAGTPPEPDGPPPEALARVTLPEAPVTLAALVAGTPELSTLAAALARTRLDGALDGRGSELTLFAPTDAAFSTLPDGLVETLMRPGNRDRLEVLVTSSMLDGRVAAADLDAALERGGGNWNLANARGTTLALSRAETPEVDGAAGEADAEGARAEPGRAGTDVVVGLVGGGEARVVRADVPATNGVLHVIDAVLIPRESLRP